MSDPDAAAALLVFQNACNETKPCQKCNGKGYHHGFGTDGHDPDWCEECGGCQFVPAHTDEQAMGLALGKLRAVNADMLAALNAIQQPFFASCFDDALNDIIAAAIAKAEGRSS
jgi:hypothetical protein